MGSSFASSTMLSAFTMMPPMGREPSKLRGMMAKGGVSKAWRYLGFLPKSSSAPLAASSL